jgi:hypothetical protein
MMFGPRMDILVVALKVGSASERLGALEARGETLFPRNHGLRLDNVHFHFHHNYSFERRHIFVAHLAAQINSPNRFGLDSWAFYRVFQFGKSVRIAAWCIGKVKYWQVFFLVEIHSLGSSLV